MSDEYTNENDKVLCKLRVKGTFFLTNGVKQACLMLSRMINITFGDELTFNCAACPDPAKRQELLDRYKGLPDCAYCGKNLATKEVPRDVSLFPDEPIIKAGSRLCISCYAGAEYQYKQERFEQWAKQYEQLEQDYKDGKIPYSMLVDAKKKYEDEHPETIIQ